jgi:arylsulfatase A-like enzyme
MPRTSLLVCLLALLGTGAAQAEEKPPPNFLILIADDVSAEDIGCYGNPRIRTPNLDKLAKEGRRYDAAFLTTSSCSPSRCSILTGRYPHSTGAGELHQPLPAEQVLVTSLLRKAGYYTAAAGKWHLGKPAMTQFDAVVAGQPSGCENWLKTLRERPKDKPFFLWFASLDAHRPYQANAIDKPHAPEDVVVPPYLPDNAETRRDLAQYYDEITRLDRHIGEVLAELDKQGVADNTFVLFMADNGRPFPRCKTTLYDSGIRTPFVLRYPPLVKPNTTGSELISSVDLAPTVLDLGGLKPTPAMQGLSFAPLLRGTPGATRRDHIVAEHNWHDYQAHERAVRTSRYLYIWNAFPQLTGSPPADAVRSPTYKEMQKLEAAGKLPDGQRSCFLKPRPAEELYDVQADPNCLRNLAGDANQSAVLKQLRGELETWRKLTDDRVPATPTPDKFDRQTGEALK